MAIPPWTVELLRRGLSDVARKASEPETLEKIKTQATEILQDLPQTAARGIDAVIRSAEAGKKSVARWSRKHTALAIPMLNASGVLLTEVGTGVPISDRTMEVGHELLVGDVIRGPSADGRLSKRLQRLLPAGDHAIAITSNFPSALTALSLLVQQRQLVVHRSHAVSLPGGQALPDAFGILVPVIQEIGSVNRADVSDFDGLENFCAIMADGGANPVQLFDFAGRDALQAVVLPVATLAASTHDQIPSAESMLTAGADFVILPGDGVCGGPQCGILVGREAEIARIEASSAWPALEASDAVRAMMAATLETAASNADQIPVRALLSTSEENLRGRAERLATRLSGSDKISTCQITADDARLTAQGRWRFASRQIRLRHASLSADAWASELQDDVPAVFASIDGDDLRVDLRWIAAADDGRLAEALGGSIESE
jgi:L-seryl-tRNA(Ser) seleniumtransferase